MNPSKKLFRVALLMVILIGGLFLLKDFNITWTQVVQNNAVVTVNFLFPMDQDKLKECIKIEGMDSEMQRYACMIDWLSPTTAEIKLQETGEIRGQKVRVLIDKAPTQYGWLKKSEAIPIQFKERVAIIEPSSELLISTDDSFVVKFNTPMNPNMLHKYLKSDAAFYIEPVRNDKSMFKFTPVKALANDHKYILTFGKGMPALSGVMLEEELSIVLKTDVKPEIFETYPSHMSKWIGLYPRITLQTDRPIVAAYLDMDGQKIAGKIKDGTRVEFILPEMLQPNKTYNWSVQVEAQTAEKSHVKPLRFSTVPIPQDRIWLEVTLGNPNQLIVHKGDKIVRKMICSTGREQFPTPVGTYYTEGKGEKFFDEHANRGANYWIKIADRILIHGMMRDEYWTPVYKVEEKLGKPQSKGNIILSEDDAKWLYERIKDDTMVIIHQ